MGAVVKASFSQNRNRSKINTILVDFTRVNVPNSRKLKWRLVNYLENTCDYLENYMIHDQSCFSFWFNPTSGSFSESQPNGNSNGKTAKNIMKAQNITIHIFTNNNENSAGSM